MSTYLTSKDAIYALHKRGYVYDFQLLGNDLLLIQEKQFIRAGDFVITECYEFDTHKKNGKRLTIFGIVALYTNVKGILLKYHNSAGCKTPPVITKKLKEMILYNEWKYSKLN